MGFVRAAFDFFAENTAMVLLIAAFIYFGVLAYKYLRYRKTGQGFSYRWRFLLGSVLIIAVAIYCLVTRTSLSDFIG